MIIHQSVDHADRISGIAKRTIESYFPQPIIRALGCMKVQLFPVHSSSASTPQQEEAQRPQVEHSIYTTLTRKAA
jgi:hypothetical protein